jgi:GAF domain-containing protein
MQPIPETLEAIDELDPYVDHGALLGQLTRMAARARSVAPHCLGVSVASREHGITFTLVATSEDIAALDAVQYLTTGPCVEAIEDGQGRATRPQELFSEPGWRAFSQATAAAGVRSTLTFPVLEGGDVVGTVNLYGASEDAFTGRHEQLAAVFGAWAPGAVSNADLSFSTRRVAEQAPAKLRTQAQVEVATGILAAASGIDVQAALERLIDAARRAGVPVPKLAETIVRLRGEGLD